MKSRAVRCVWIAILFLLFSESFTYAGRGPKRVVDHSGREALIPSQYRNSDLASFDSSESSNSSGPLCAPSSDSEFDESESRREFWRKRCKQSVKTGLSDGVISGLLAGATYLLQGHPVPLSGLMYMTADLYGPRLRGFVSNLKPDFLRNKQEKAYLKQVEDLFVKVEESRRKNLLSASIQERVESYMRVVIASLDGNSALEVLSDEPELAATKPEKAIYIVRALMALPTEKMKLEKDWEKIRSELVEKLNLFEEPFLREILELTSLIIVASESEGKEGWGKTAIYFEGDPGTLKTTTALEMASALKLPLCKIELNMISPQAIQGSPETPSVITNCLVNRKTNPLGYSNIFIFFDGAHLALNRSGQAALYQAEFQELLEKKKGFFFDRYLQENIDVSGVTFIFAGNEGIRSMNDAGALASRFYPPLKFGKISQRKKEFAAVTIAADLALNKYRNYEITEEDQSIIKDIAAEDFRLFSGVRYLQSVVDKYLVRKYIEKRFHQEVTAFDIKAAYMPYLR